MYGNVMVTLDGSELAECVLPHVKAIAVGCNVGKVTLVRVVPPLQLFHGLEASLTPEERQQIEADSRKVAQDYLSGVAQRLAPAGMMVSTEVLFGAIVDQLVEYASGHEVDLIVIATHGRSGISRWVWGSVADRMLRSARVPIMMVRAPGSVPVVS